jgi:hypothetical protein
LKCWDSYALKRLLVQIRHSTGTSI